MSVCLSVCPSCVIHGILVGQDDRWLKKSERIFKFCRETIFALIKNQPETCLRLFVQGALAADQIQDETITYEFISQVSICYNVTGPL